MAFNLLSPADQVALHLRDEILSRRWKDYMPGIAHLEAELGVNHVTINGALKLLEQQGLLVSQGKRRRRRIVIDATKVRRRAMRIRILAYDRDSRYEPDQLAILGELTREGFEARFARKSLDELGMDPARVARFVQGVEADAWIVSSASPKVLAWFAGQTTPVFALFGGFSGLPIAGTGVRKSPVMAQLVHRLADLGHERIVFLTHPERVKPQPALFERNFLAVLQARGIAAGAYNLPVWEQTPKSLHRCIDDLFRHTPPTAIISDEPEHFIALQIHLANKGITAPRDVSLFCTGTDPSFNWCQEPVTHTEWDLKKVVNRAVRWASNISSGKDDREQKYFNAKLVEGATIGPLAK